MGSNASDDPEPGGMQIDEKLDRLSDRVRGYFDAITPENTDLWKRIIKIGLSVLLTVMFIYWVLAWQFGIQLFEF